MTLTSIELRWARAAMSAIFPSGAHPRIAAGIADLDIDGFLRVLLADLPLRAGLGVRVAIWICALAPLWILRRPALLTSLDAEPRTRVVGALLQSSSYAVRQLVLLLKVFGAMLFASSPAVRSAIFPVPVASGTRLVPLSRKPEADDASEVA